MGDEGMPDERRRNQIDDVAGSAAPTADGHRSTARDAYWMDTEPRRGCGESPCEHE